MGGGVCVLGVGQEAKDVLEVTGDQQWKGFLDGRGL